jgi:hypothetical protein
MKGRMGSGQQKRPKLTCRSVCMWPLGLDGKGNAAGVDQRDDILLYVLCGALQLGM